MDVMFASVITEQQAPDSQLLGYKHTFTFQGKTEQLHAVGWMFELNKRLMFTSRVKPKVTNILKLLNKDNLST